MFLNCGTRALVLVARCGRLRGLPVHGTATRCSGHWARGQFLQRFQIHIESTVPLSLDVNVFDFVWLIFIWMFAYLYALSYQKGYIVSEMAYHVSIGALYVRWRIIVSGMTYLFHDLGHVRGGLYHISTSSVTMSLKYDLWTLQVYDLRCLLFLVYTILINEDFSLD